MSQTFTLNHLDPSTRKLVSYALQTAKDRRHGSLSVWVLLALMYQSDDATMPNSASVALVSQGLNQERWIEDVERLLMAIPANAPLGAGNATIDQTVADVFNSALKRAQPENRQIQMQDLWIEMLLLPQVAEQLSKFGVSNEGRREILKSWGVNNVADLDPSSFIAKYCKDLTSMALSGDLDPVVGRDDEIREAMNILQRRTKNNPIFVGEPGVGKTAMVEGLAHRMIKNEVPETLKNKSLLSLDLGAIIAGAKYKGELEERVKGLVKEIQDRDDVVLFIDEIHTLVNSSGEAGGVGQLLKPALARGELRCIGATTPDEYRVYLEKDPALERRFQKITVLEPSLEDAVAILRGVKDKYALHHGVDITDQAIVEAVKLSSRYMTDRQLPDKAIDLMDAAAARVRTILDSKPEELDRVDRRLIQLKVQREAIKKEEEFKGELDEDTLKHLQRLETQIEASEQLSQDLNDRLSKEKTLHDNVVAIQQKVSQANIDLQKAQHAQNLSAIGQIQYGTLPKLEEELRAAKKVLRSQPNLMMQDQVTPDQIAEIVSRRTGIPVSKMHGGEQEKLAQMETLLGKQVIGQPEAVESVSDAVRRSRSGLSDPNKPIGSFLFLGPTGVGKTELTKVLSSFLFDRKEAMVRIDMSEFMEKQSVSRLIGAPPGYVGYEEGGVLTEAIRQSPYSVILFDEVEKAHPDVFNVLLQVLDEGHLTDGRGRTVDFKNTVIIMTSNLGAGDIQELTAQNATLEEIKDSVMDNVKNFFRPEFINRLDETVIFKPLDRPAIGQIARLQVNSLVKRLRERKIETTVTDAAIEHLATAGFDPLMGARPLKRAIQQELENPLAKEIVSGRVKQGEMLIVDSVDGRLSWSTTAQTICEEAEPAASVETSVEPLTLSGVSEKAKRPSATKRQRKDPSM